MARHRRLDLAQRTGSGKLPEQKRDELPARVEAAHQIVAAMLADEPIVEFH